ncbi:hypothetical protein [Paenibacillus cisolokensis]|uniref:hypothetical protein n=1 Tax=Paenibacillus cisolokensis TaxID=1658519 RepID=UPI001BCE8C3F|nr:hypothetical protein [Paenibacillus cisolokensis]
MDGTIGVRRDLENKCPYLWDFWTNITRDKSIFAKENSEQKYYLSEDIFQNRFHKSSKINYFAFISIEPIESIVVNKRDMISAFKLFIKGKTKANL